jgi:mannose-6-phosphate isomerase-like protein (cupin superfamily)
MKGIKDEPAPAHHHVHRHPHNKEQQHERENAAPLAHPTTVLLSNPDDTAVELPGPPRRITAQLYASGLFETAYEVIDPTAEIPWHSHDAQTELFFFISGEGILYHQPIDESAPVTEVTVKPLTSAAVPPKTKYGLF